MFEYLEPEASDNQAANLGAGSLPLPSGAGGHDGGPRSLKPLKPEKLRHLLYGSLAAIDRTIKILHAHGYADPNDWSDPIPVPPSGAISLEEKTGPSSEVRTWMVILTKTLLLE
jgi:hypothetical protein